MKILLLHPRPTPGDSCTVPYSCLAVAAPLVAGGFDVEILDEFSAPDYQKQLSQAAAQADVVGISCFTGYQIDSAVRSAKIVRDLSPDLPLIWGGYHPSLYPSETLKHELVDYVVAGQGEWVFKDFVSRLSGKGDAAATPGLWRLVDGKPTQNPGAIEFRGIENFPPFPFHLVPLDAFLIDSLTSKSISYHSSLGCPYRCNFCTVTEIYSKRWSGFPPERVLSDVKFLLEKTGAHSIEFYDNNFFVNEERSYEIARQMYDQKLGILWSAEARPDTIANYDDEMLSLLTRSGFKWVFIGAESGHDKVLDLMERDHSVDDIVAAAEKLSKYKIKVTFSFNLGYPGEPSDNFSRTEALCHELKRINHETELMVYITTAYESTPAFHKTQEVASKTTDSLEDWSHLDQRKGDKKAWLSAAYSQKLFNFTMVTFFATSFLHGKFKRLFRANPFLRVLHFLANLHMRFHWYRSILDLRILNRLFLITSNNGRKKKIDMWSGRS